MPNYPSVQYLQFSFTGLLILSLILLTGGCTTNPEFGDTPHIEFISLSKDTMIQNSLNTDSLFLTIGFTDGDGDVGTGTASSNENIVIIDNRSGQIFDRYKLPEIPGAENGIEGEIRLKMFTTCCVFPDNIPPCLSPPDYPVNTVTFDIYMIDDAGNQSNTITTNEVTLLCN